MKGKVGRRIMTTVITAITAAAVLFFVWVIFSPGTIREYEGKNSLSEKYVMKINGAPKRPVKY